MTLQHDVYGCVQGGITIAKSGVTVDLNGHTITGLGEGDGIAASGVTGVTIKDGSIDNFEAGLRLTGVSNSRVLDTRLRLNSDASAWVEGSGIEVAEGSVQTRINENQAHHNGGDGIFIEGTGTQLNRNHAGCNGGMGIASPVVSAGGENWAGGNGDNVGCVGVVCRISFSCGTE